MKKNFMRGAMLITAMAAGMTFVSCNRDETIELEVDKNILSTGIVSGIDGGFFDIPVKSNGEWTASLPQECEWAGLLGTKGSGDETVTLSVDPNYTGAGRSTTVTICNGESTYNVAVTQEMSDENAEFCNIAMSKGLGYGYDLRTFKVKSNAVFNLKAMNKLAEDDEFEYGTLFESDRKSILQVADVNIDSVETKKDSLCIKLSLEIAYGTFKFGLSGGYHSGEERSTTSTRYTSAANYPSLEARMGYAEAFSHYNDWVTASKPTYIDGVKANGKDYRGSLLSNAFVKKMDSLTVACAKNDSVKAKKVSNEILNTFGPTVIVSSTMGGAFALEFYVDSIFTKEVMGIDSAKVSADIKSGMFDLKADVSADYQKDMTSILEHSVCSCELKGGRSSDQATIYEHFKNKEYGKLNAAVREWISNMVTSEDKNTNTAELIKVDIVPIWIFAEGDAQNVLKSHVMEVYKDVKEMVTLGSYN